MKISNKDFNFFAKKKKKKDLFPSLETLKLVSFITGTALAVNKGLKEKLKNQEFLHRSSKQSQTEEAGLLIAGFVGGAIAGALSALLLTPESGEDLRKRVTSYFDDTNGQKKAKKAVKNAKKNVQKKVNDNT